jgi:hypothetical protein
VSGSLPPRQLVVLAYISHRPQGSTRHMALLSQGANSKKRPCRWQHARSSGDGLLNNATHRLAARLLLITIR